MALPKETIREIIKAHHEGEPRSHIAQRYHIDVATVRYHVEKFEDLYGSTAGIYSLIPPPKKPCEHPSLKCLVCGRAQDNIHRKELAEIRRLRGRLEAAVVILKRHEYDVSDIEV